MTARYGDSQLLAHLRTACAPPTATHTSNKKQDTVPGVWKRAGLAHWSVLFMRAATEPITMKYRILATISAPCSSSPQLPYTKKWMLLGKKLPQSQKVS